MLNILHRTFKNKWCPKHVVTVVYHAECSSISQSLYATIGSSYILLKYIINLSHRPPISISPIFSGHGSFSSPTKQGKKERQSYKVCSCDYALKYVLFKHAFQKELPKKRFVYQWLNRFNSLLIVQCQLQLQWSLIL